MGPCLKLSIDFSGEGRHEGQESQPLGSWNLFFSPALLARTAAQVPAKKLVEKAQTLESLLGANDPK
jgi:hypothetical protein